jgi:hypothetical protein
LSLCLLFAGCHTASRERFVQRVPASVLPRIEFALEPGQGIELRARTSSDAVAVLHVWDVEARTEVAYAEMSRWFGRSAQLRYRNPHAQRRSYQLLVHAQRSVAGAQVDIDRDGKPWLTRLPLGGVRVNMQSGQGYTHSVAAVPGGGRSARLLALNAQGRLVAVDDNSGATHLPQLAGRDDIAALVLGADQVPGVFNLYANDHTDDRDGDGLGRKLERALGTCDSPAQRGCNRTRLLDYYRQIGTRDSDRDGLDDRAEVLGASAEGLDFPRYGADPRHKDVFVEIDHHARLADVGFSEPELAEVAALFRTGSAHSLRNPDGRPGVSLHFDAGFEPTDPAHVTLFGQYGGSGRAANPEYRSARAHDFTPARSGYFRYAFSTKRGRGQAHGDAFTVNRDLTRVTIFAHELGHTLGLAHHGHDTWGRVNCKPNYMSIMNYLYQNRYEVGFSRSPASVLNPASVLERKAATHLNRTFLRDPPLEFDVVGDDIDWNRNGVIDAEYVRAGLTWGTYKSCGAAALAQATLASGDLAATTPVLLSHDSGLYALWLDQQGHVVWRRGTLENAQYAWSEAAQIPGRDGVLHMTATLLPDGSAALACVRKDHALELWHLRLTAQGLQLVAASVVPAVLSERTPSIAVLTVDPAFYGTAQLLVIAVLSADAEPTVLQVSAASPSGPFSVRPWSGLPLTAAVPPSIATLPTGETCGVVPDREGYLRFHCYDVHADTWRDVSERAFEVGLGPHTDGPVALAFHAHTNAVGTNTASSCGALYVSYTEPPVPSVPHPENPHFLVSECLSPTRRAADHIALRWRGTVIDEWTTLVPGSGVALAETRDSGLAALLVIRDDAHGGARVEFLPHADAEFDAELGAGDDFAVMERGICMGIRSAGDCGDASTSDY